MNKVFLLLATIIISCLCIVATASAQSRHMYSWTDENGVVHFTDERPAGKEVSVIDIPDSEPPAAASPALPTDEANEPSLAQQRRDEIAQKRQENREQAAVLEAECAAKRAEVERLEPHRRVFFTNEEGETERMDDVERTNEAAEARAFIEANCKDY